MFASPQERTCSMRASMSAKCHKRTLRSDSAHGLRGWDAPCPRDLDSEVSKVAVVRVGLGYMVIGHRDSATPSGGDRGSHLWEEPHRVHRRLVDRRVRGPQGGENFAALTRQLLGSAQKLRNKWASIKPIVAHPFGGVRDDNDPLLNFASAPGDFVACCQSSPRRRGLQNHSSGWSEGAWRHKHQRRMLQLLLLQ
jgi:hypothetical protein